MCLLSSQQCKVVLKLRKSFLLLLIRYCPTSIDSSVRKCHIALYIVKCRKPDCKTNSLQITSSIRHLY